MKYCFVNELQHHERVQYEDSIVIYLANIQLNKMTKMAAILKRDKRSFQNVGTVYICMDLYFLKRMGFFYQLMIFLFFLFFGFLSVCDVYKYC